MNRREALAALVALPEVTRISVAKPQPDDVIVVEYDGMMSPETAERIKATLQRVWPRRQVLVLSDGMKIKLIQGGTVPVGREPW